MIINDTADQKSMRVMYFVPALAALCTIPVGLANAQAGTMPPQVRNGAASWADEMADGGTLLAGIEFFIEGRIMQAGDLGIKEPDEIERLRRES